MYAQEETIEGSLRVTIRPQGKTVDFIVPDQEPAASRDSSERKLLTPWRCEGDGAPRESRGSVARIVHRRGRLFHDRRDQSASPTRAIFCVRIHENGLSKLSDEMKAVNEQTRNDFAESTIRL